MKGMMITKSGFKFPQPKKNKIVETKFMLQVINTTLAIHPGNAAWYGESRIGETTTAQYCVRKIIENYDSTNINAFRAVHFECGEIAAWSGNEQKKGIKALYNAVIGRLDEGMYRMAPIESLVETTIRGFEKKNIQLVFIDEAGNLSVDAIRGIMMCFDMAKNMNYPLSLVFVGMDDLPIKLERLPQIKGRIHSWSYFDSFSFDDMENLLCEIYPHYFDKFIQKNCRELVTTIFEMFGGFPGLVIPYMHQVENYMNINANEDTELSTTILRMIHYKNNMNREKSIEKSRELNGGKPPRKSQSRRVGKPKKTKNSKIIKGGIK